MGAWRARDPVVRFRNWLVRHGWWDEKQEQELRQQTRQQVRGWGRWVSAAC
jgi:2-oxoisovalerate dehydrogenase E1 component alpha subunit